MIALFGLFAEVERDLISERTKEGLASTTSSRPARSLRADYKARAALMLYFNTNMGATLI